MSCRLLREIFRVTQTNLFKPVLKKIMLNAFPNHNSLLKNTTTSFYTILTSNTYKNHKLIKQKNALKSSARLESNTNQNKQVKKTKICKSKKRTSSKIKYRELRICGSKNKCKEKMICLRMPISKLKQIRSKAKLNEALTDHCRPCYSIQTSINKSPKTCNIACNSNKASKPSKLDRKYSNYPTKPCNLINNCASFKQPNPTHNKAPAKHPNPINNCAPSKQSGLANGYVSSKKIGTTNTSAPSTKIGSTNTYGASKQPRSTNNRAHPIIVHKINKRNNKSLKIVHSFKEYKIAKKK